MKNIKISAELRQSLTDILPIYENAVAKCTEDDWYFYLLRKKICHGICFAVLYSFDFNIYGEMEKIGAELKFNVDFWHKTPNYCQTYSEAIETLKWRINIIKELLKTK